MKFTKSYIMVRRWFLLNDQNSLKVALHSAVTEAGAQELAESLTNLASREEDDTTIQIKDILDDMKGARNMSEEAEANASSAEASASEAIDSLTELLNRMECGTDGS